MAVRNVFFVMLCMMMYPALGAAFMQRNIAPMAVWVVATLLVCAVFCRRK